MSKHDDMFDKVFGGIFGISDEDLEKEVNENLDKWWKDNKTIMLISAMCGVLVRHGLLTEKEITIERIKISLITLKESIEEITKNEAQELLKYEKDNLAFTEKREKDTLVKQSEMMRNRLLKMLESTNAELQKMEEEE